MSLWHVLRILQPTLTDSLKIACLLTYSYAGLQMPPNRSQQLLAMYKLLFLEWLDNLQFD